MINNFDITDFLQNYWQKKPLLIRQAFNIHESPVTPEELAGLACEEGVESRIITEIPEPPFWTLQHGPFTVDDFQSLPSSHWTLLVQGINKLLPEFDTLLQEFTFIPTWRIDDVMVSYAVNEGSVGPHTDQYDVFLLQGSGKRKWMIGDQPLTDEQCLPGISVNVLKNFNPDKEWILEPGDMLYLPSGIPHHGVAIDECMTFSIGFRAPSHGEMFSSFIDNYLESLPATMRYQDPEITDNAHPGEITAEALESVRKILRQHLEQDINPRLESWFGQFITNYLAEDVEAVAEPVEISEFTSMLENAIGLYRPPEIRANYIKKPDNQYTLFVNGEEYHYEMSNYLIIEQFCDKNTFIQDEFASIINNKQHLEFIYDMYRKGFIEVLDND